MRICSISIFVCNALFKSLGQGLHCDCDNKFHDCRELIGYERYWDGTFDRRGNRIVEETEKPQCGLVKFI